MFLDEIALCYTLAGFWVTDVSAGITRVAIPVAPKLWDVNDTSVGIVCALSINIRRVRRSGC